MRLLTLYVPALREQEVGCCFLIHSLRLEFRQTFKRKQTCHLSKAKELLCHKDILFGLPRSLWWGLYCLEKIPQPSIVASHV